MKKKTLVTIIIVVAVLAATGVSIFAINKSKKKGGGMPGGWGGFGGFGGASVTSVRTVPAELKTLTDFVNTNGEIETQTSIEVFPSIGGQVVQVNVSLGSPVKKGDVIAYIDPSTPGSYYAKSPITAPISGSILTSPVKPGTKVSTASVFTRIGDIDNLQVTAKIPERYVADIAIGQKAHVSLEAYPGIIFEAYVVRISPVLDSATRTKEIILNFNKTDSRINAGMFAKVRLFTKEYGGEIVIQQDALINNNDKYYLYVLNPDGETVTKREVTLGKNIDGKYQILSGVSVGETVVVEGMLTLAEGSKVKDISNPDKEPKQEKMEKPESFGQKPEEKPKKGKAPKGDKK